ncbi:hypothetical protein B0H11DRAFT_807994 [Mycena galericulata]|nr:hypothetical protein B0H11DRAFT_807994 [Mycena galericulata]
MATNHSLLSGRKASRRALQALASGRVCTLNIPPIPATGLATPTLRPASTACADTASSRSSLVAAARARECPSSSQTRRGLDVSKTPCLHRLQLHDPPPRVVVSPPLTPIIERSQASCSLHPSSPFTHRIPSRRAQPGTAARMAPPSSHPTSLTLPRPRPTTGASFPFRCNTRIAPGAPGHHPPLRRRLPLLHLSVDPESESAPARPAARRAMRLPPLGAGPGNGVVSRCRRAEGGGRRRGWSPCRIGVVECHPREGGRESAAPLLPAHARND